MLAMITSIISFVKMLTPLAIALIALVEVPGNGAEKKAQVIATLKAMIDANHIVVPDALKPYEDTILGGAVDCLVWVLNRFFPNALPKSQS
jgi:hypothetical protein